MKAIVIENSPLGSLVELKEPTVGQWISLQSPDKEEHRVLWYVAAMLHIDGQPVTWDQFCALPMSQVNSLIAKAMSLIEGGEGNA